MKTTEEDKNDNLSAIEENNLENDLKKAKQMLSELLVWADNWLPDEAKDQGAREVVNKAKQFLKL